MFAVPCIVRNGYLDLPERLKALKTFIVDILGTPDVTHLIVEYYRSASNSILLSFESEILVTAELIRDCHETAGANLMEEATPFLHRELFINTKEKRRERPIGTSFSRGELVLEHDVCIYV